MMKADMQNAIIVPGRPDKDEFYDPQQPANSDNHWYPWLARQLQLRDIWGVVIDPPKPWQPRYDVWSKEFERFDITADTILVGHSCGGGFLVRWLSEHPDAKVGKVVLVAPWLNPENNPASDTADFFDFKIDPDMAAHTKGITIFHSDNDQATIQRSVAIIREQAKDIGYKEFHKGHFCREDLGTDAFPELLEWLA